MISTHPKRRLDRFEWVDMLRFRHPSLLHASRSRGNHHRSMNQGSFYKLACDEKETPKPSNLDFGVSFYFSAV